MRNYETSPAWETSPAAAAAGLKLVQSSYLVRICSVVLQPLAGNCIFASNTSIGAAAVRICCCSPRQGRRKNYLKKEIIKNYGRPLRGPCEKRTLAFFSAICDLCSASGMQMEMVSSQGIGSASGL